MRSTLHSSRSGHCARWSRRTFGLALMCVLAGLAHSVSDSPRDYAALAVLQPVSNEGLQRVVLPLAVLQGSRSAALADLRVFNAEGQAVPIGFAGAPAEAALVMRSVHVPRFVWPASGQPGDVAEPAGIRVRVNAAGAVVHIDGVGPVPPGATGAASRAPARVWLLDVSALLHEGERLAALRLDWPAQPGGVAVTAEVETSDDATQWRPLTQAPLLETAAAVMAPASAASAEVAASAVAPASAVTPASVSRKRIVLPADASTAPPPRYLRLSLSAAVPLSDVQAELRASEAPLVLDRASVAFQPVSPDNGAAAPREWRADLQGPVPLQRLQLHLPQANTLASFFVEQRASDTDRWQPVAALTAYRLVRQGREVEAPPLELRAQGMRHWRLRLVDGTPDIGSGVVQAEWYWPPRQLLFAARGSAPFQLAVGRDAAVPAALPLATLVPDHRRGDEYKLPLATLGPVVAQRVVARSVGEQMAEASPADRRKWLLWAVLAVAVVGLAWLARRLMGELKSVR